MKQKLIKLEIEQKKFLTLFNWLFLMKNYQYLVGLVYILVQVNLFFIGTSQPNNKYILNVGR